MNQNAEVDENAALYKIKNKNPSNGQNYSPPKDKTRAQLLGSTELPALAVGKEKPRLRQRQQQAVNSALFLP